MLCPALFARAQFRDYPTAPVCRFPVAGLSGFCPCVKSGRCRPWILCGGAVAPGVLCVRFSLCRCGSLIGREKGRGCRQKIPRGGLLYPVPSALCASCEGFQRQRPVDLLQRMPVLDSARVCCRRLLSWITCGIDFDFLSANTKA